MEKGELNYSLNILIIIGIRDTIPPNKNIIPIQKIILLGSELAEPKNAIPIIIKKIAPTKVIGFALPCLFIFFIMF